MAFRHRDFALYCLARLLSATAVQMQTVAIGWLVYDRTSNPLALGLVGLAAFLPAIGLALFTGHVADQFDRRTVLLVCYAVTVAAACGLLLWLASGEEAIWPVYALTVLFGTTRAFANPAGQALVPNLVPIEHLGNAIAWNSSAWQTATIAGPAIGGLLYAFGGTIVFAVAAVLFTVTFVLIAAINHRKAQGSVEKASWHTLVAGIRFIRAKPAIFGAISLDSFAVLLGGATALLPIYARDILMVGPAGLGLLRSMPAIGAACTALFLAWRPLERHTGRRMFQAVAIFGIATVGFGLSENLDLVADFTVRHGCRRHGQRVHSADTGADRHAGCDARSRLGCEQRVHWRFQRTRRIRIRHAGLGDRHRPGGGCRRAWHAAGDLAVGALVP